MNHQLISKVQHIWCSATITKQLEDVFVRLVCDQAQKNREISEYVVYLSTTGGSPLSAVTLYNFIKSIPQKTTIYNMGYIMSAGVPFFLAFDNRFGVPDCTFMIHQTTLPSELLPKQFNVDDVHNQQSILLGIDRQVQNIILVNTDSLTLKKIKTECKKSKVYHSNEAQKIGFISHIKTPKLPESGVIYITDEVLLQMNKAL